jgi:protein-tyrosine phosphatase
VLLLTTENGEVFELHTENQKSFLENRKEMDIVAENSDWLNLVKRGEENSFPLPATFEWRSEEGADEYRFLLSQNSDMRNAREISCKENGCEIYHLYIGKKYYWQVRAVRNGKNVSVSEVRSFTVSSRTPRMIGAGGMTNIRDLGGYSCAHGRRVRQGMIYRGCEMEFHHEITEDGIRVLRDELGIRTELDLRREAVGVLDRSALGDSVDYALIRTEAYNHFFEDKETCKKLFTLLLDKERYPFYVHCWGGADRTGTLALMILAMLYVDRKDIEEDYELTSLSYWGKRSVNSEHYQKLLASLDEYGDENDGMSEKCIKFLLSCGISASDIEKIRDIMTEPCE